MSVEFRYRCYVISDHVAEIVSGLSKLKEASNDYYEVGWDLEGKTLNFFVVGTSIEVNENFSVFFSDQKERLSLSEEYVLSCFCDHEEESVPVFARVSGKNYMGVIDIGDYFDLSENPDDTIMEIGKRLSSGLINLGVMDTEWLENEYGLEA